MRVSRPITLHILGIHNMCELLWFYAQCTDEFTQGMRAINALADLKLQTPLFIPILLVRLLHDASLPVTHAVLSLSLPLSWSTAEASVILKRQKKTHLQ